MATLSLLACLFAATGPGDALRIEPVKGLAHVRVIAHIPADLAARIPKGKLTQDQGETWLRLALVNDKTGQAGSAMFGAYERQGDRLLFTPRFPLLHEHRYRAAFGPADGKAISAEYRVPPRPATPPAVVEKIYPGTDVLPANHLRFYIYFSRPMRGGKDIFEQIRILDANGEEITDAWLRDELWTDDGKCLILYIHPGRIKWGLLLRMLLGPVLVPGREYTLVITPDMLDADEQRLGKEFRKKFRTTDEDRKRIELSDWRIKAPASGTRQALLVSFPKALDRLGLERSLKVVDASGNAVKGRVEISAGERSWSFQPEQTWQAAAYRVEVDPDLEDTAGNTPRRAFDTDLKAKEPPPQKVSLPFSPTATP
ncbi:MAG TPA: hypothetical protein VEL76_20945 [Gemmataceae bacterium]|nr:hypothetical protein [Gemmataceae bacterium]